MRHSIAYVAPLVAAAYAQSSESLTIVPEVSGSVTISSTYTYSNYETQFLSQTNSLGVVTGEPTLSGNTAVVTTQPAVVTSQPVVATIPAGLPTGINTVYVGNSSFSVSVASSTTVVIPGGSAPTDASLTTGATAGISTGTGSAASAPTGSSGSGSNGSNSSNSSSSSTTSSGSGAAATGVKFASGAMVGIGAVFAALL